MGSTSEQVNATAAKIMQIVGWVGIGLILTGFVGLVIAVAL